MQRGFNDMDDAELAAHLADLRAREQAAVGRLATLADERVTRTMTPARVKREVAMNEDELKRTRMRISSVESVQAQRQAWHDEAAARRGR